jgi:predicted nucleotidyltransferase
MAQTTATGLPAMPTQTAHFTPYPEVDAWVAELLARVQRVLGEQLVGLYLDGSLANGDFDAASDIDFVAATRDETSPAAFAALQAMHRQLARLDSPWATELEGSYVSLRGLRRYDPDFCRYPNLERGPGERLKWAEHGASWDVHRWVLREKGIVVTGPPPHALVDPVSPEQLCASLHADLLPWLAGFLQDAAGLQQRGYQSYLVLTVCRMSFTLATGQVASKAVAARWAQAQLDPRWTGLIERAWENRSRPAAPADPQEVAATQAFVRYALARAA